MNNKEEKLHGIGGMFHTLQVQWINPKTPHAACPMVKGRWPCGKKNWRCRFNPQVTHKNNAAHRPCDSMAELCRRLGAAQKLFSADGYIIERADFAFDSFIASYDELIPVARALTGIWKMLAKPNKHGIVNAGITRDGEDTKSMFVKDSDVEIEFYNKPIHDPTDPSKARLEVRLIRLNNRNPFEPENLCQHIEQILLCIKAKFQDYVDMQTQALLTKPKGKGKKYFVGRYANMIVTRAQLVKLLRDYFDVGDPNKEASRLINYFDYCLTLIKKAEFEQYIDVLLWILGAYQTGQICPVYNGIAMEDDGIEEQLWNRR